jgi:hypothetical protein
MRRLVEFRLEEGGSVLIESEEPETEGAVRVARPGELAVQAGLTLEAAIERIKPATNAVITQLRQLVESPDEIEMEFGIKLSAAAGAVVASAATEANYKVTLKWKKPEPQIVASGRLTAEHG